MICLSAYSFRRTYRLLKTDEYSSVFNWRFASSNRYFQVYARPNELGYARLGLVVGKKVAKRAHQRNYIKRTVREWFRHHRAQLDPTDYVVRAKLAFERSHRSEAVKLLAELFAKLSRCRAV